MPTLLNRLIANEDFQEAVSGLVVAHLPKGFKVSGPTKEETSQQKEREAWAAYRAETDSYEAQFLQVLGGVFGRIKKEAMEFVALRGVPKAACKAGILMSNDFVVSTGVAAMLEKQSQSFYEGIAYTQDLTRQFTDVGKADFFVGYGFDVKNAASYDLLKQRSVAFRKEVIGTTENHIRGLLAEGMDAGESLPSLTKRIGEYFSNDSIRNRARVIARTETIWASNAGQELAWEASGVVEAKEWLVAEDERLCEHCMAAAKMFNRDMGGRALGLGQAFFAQGTELNSRSIAGAVGFMPDCKGFVGLVLKGRKAAACLTSEDKSRAARALASYVPQTKRKLRIATKSEFDLAATINKLGLGRAVTTAHTAPFDVIVYGATGKVEHLLEVKTVVRAKNDKLTMHGESLATKLEAAKEHPGAKVWTFAWDKRPGRGNQKYIAPGLGSYRLNAGVLADGKVGSLEEAVGVMGGVRKSLRLFRIVGRWDDVVTVV